MTDPQKVLLLGPHGGVFAELLIPDEEEGWFTGRVISQRFPPELSQALAWYDEVAREQMLSYLDEATAAVQRFELQAKFSDGSTHTPYSLHVSPAGEVSFRISPVLPPPQLAKERIP